LALSQGQYGIIGLVTSPDDLVVRLGRWSAGRGPLYVLLASRIRQLVDDGELLPGAPLPPDRALAAALAVGRTTVVAAYDLLTQEGKIVRRQGSGTRVAPVLRPDPGRPVDATNPLFMHLLETPDHVIQLACAAPTSMPSSVVEAYTKALGISVTNDLGYYPAGHPALRAAIADRYAKRGVPTEPNQVLVTTGAQQALSLLGKHLVGPGDKVVVETPTYPGALEVFRESAAIFRPIPSGDVEALVRVMRADRPTAAYLIPTHHNPTGTVMPTLARRRAAEEAAATGVQLIEDEVLADLGFNGEMPTPLAAYGPVLTVGSLSKVIWGGLRVGWVRGPAPLIMQLARLKAVHDLGSNLLSQLAAAELVANLDTLREQRIADLRAQHDRLCAELTEHLPDWRFTPAAGGQSLWIGLPHGDAISFGQLALRYGVAVLPGGSLDVTGKSKDHLRIPFLASTEMVSVAVRQLAAAWREYVTTALTALVV
jgi:DNA-binding transcriptional MocR family regulator